MAYMHTWPSGDTFFLRYLVYGMGCGLDCNELISQKRDAIYIKCNGRLTMIVLDVVYEGDSPRRATRKARLRLRACP